MNGYDGSKTSKEKAKSKAPHVNPTCGHPPGPLARVSTPRDSSESPSIWTPKNILF